MFLTKGSNFTASSAHHFWRSDRSWITTAMYRASIMEKTFTFRHYWLKIANIFFPPLTLSRLFCSGDPILIIQHLKIIQIKFSGFRVSQLFSALRHLFLGIFQFQQQTVVVTSRWRTWKISDNTDLFERCREQGIQTRSVWTAKLDSSEATVAKAGTTLSLLVVDSFRVRRRVDSPTKW